MTSAKIRYYFVVSGRVQGVGYRYFCEQLANRFNITGWVRNRADGCVELEAQGPQDRLDAFVVKLEEGPILGHITELRKQELKIHSDESSFIIKF